jgi:Rha family phage regulatory protein
MTQLVFIDNGKTVTDSLTVAEVFGKEHKRVMQDIRELECSEEFNRHNFVLISYQDSLNREKPKYLITQDGFSFLVMGYTGREAARFKEMYIAEFNRMRDRVNNLPASPLKALMQATHNLLASQELIVERLDEVEEKVEKQITLNSGEQRRLQKAIAQKIYSIEPDEEFRSELFRQLYKEVKDRWQVPSYKDILRQELQSVLKYVEAWVPIRRAG